MVTSSTKEKVQKSIKKALLSMPGVFLDKIDAHILHDPADIELLDTNHGPVFGIRLNSWSKSKIRRFVAFAPGNKAMAVRCREVLDELIRKLELDKA